MNKNQQWLLTAGVLLMILGFVMNLTTRETPPSNHQLKNSSQSSSDDLNMFSAKNYKKTTDPETDISYFQ